MRHNVPLILALAIAATIALFAFHFTTTQVVTTPAFAVDTEVGNSESTIGQGRKLIFGGSEVTDAEVRMILRHLVCSSYIPPHNRIASSLLANTFTTFSSTSTNLLTNDSLAVPTITRRW